MKRKSINRKKSESAINQLGDPSSVTVPPVPNPTNVTPSTGTAGGYSVTPSTGTAGGYSVTPSTGTAGGTVSTGKAVVPGRKSFSNDTGQTRAKSKAATFRQQAQQLRAAAATCSYNIANLGWQWCSVTVEFEDNRTITIEEAVAYAKELDQRALMAAIDAAILQGATGSLSCNKFAGAVGRDLDIPYFRNPIDDDHHMADDMYDFISGAVNSSASGWIKLNEGNVQDMADEGKFIVGVAHSKTDEHGHIVIAVSSDLPKVKDHGRNIPCVLDGQHAKEKLSITPSMVFGSSVSNPIWAFYKD